MGLAQNQLSEEIRSLFQGTITPRNTRIATALGITNDDIRRARELGNLGTFLKTRFEAISKSGERLADTFSGQVNAASDAFKQLIAESSKPLFGQLKAGLKDFNTKIFKDLQDEPIIDPQALKVFDQLFKGIAQGVRNIRASFSDLDIQGFADTFGLIGRSIGTIATVIGATFSSAFKTASPLLTLFNTILNVLNGTFTLVKALDERFGGVLSTITFSVLRVGALIFGLKRLAALTRSLWVGAKLFTTAMSGATLVATAAEVKFLSIAQSLAKMRAAAVALSRPILIAAGALLVLDLALKAFGVEGGAIGAIGDLFGKLNDAIDSTVGSWIGLNEEADKVSSDAPGIIADGFKQLREEVQELSETIRVDLIRSTAAFADQAAALKLTPSGAEQLRTLSNIFLDSAKALEDAKKALNTTFTDQATIENSLARLRLDSSAPDERNLENLRLRLVKERNQLQKGIDELRKKLPNAFNSGNAFARGSAELLENLNSLVESQRKKSEEILKVEKQIEDVKKQDEELEGRINAKLVERASLLQTIDELERGVLQKQAKAIELAAEEARVQFESSRPGLELDAIRERAVTDLLRIGDEGRIRALDAIVTARRAELDAAEQLQRRNNDISQQLDLIARFGEINADWAVKARLAAEEHLFYLLQQRDALGEIEQAQIARLQEEARLAKLRETGSIGDGFSETLKKLANEKDSLFLVGENLAQGIFTGIPETLGSIVTTSLRDGFSSAEAADAFRNLLFNSIGQFVQDLATAFLANLLGGGAADLLGTEAAIAGVQQAVLTMATSSTTAATTIGSALSTGAGAIITAGNAAAAAIYAAAAAASLAGTGAGAGQIVGAAFGAFATGGPVPNNVQGFAGGGTPRRRRPLGLDPRDTIPAMLRPGEWVIRPEAVKHYGHRLFAMLNGRKINRTALSGIRGAAGPAVAPPRSGGYATGGPVARTPSAPSSPSVQTVLQFHDEQTLDRALAAGSQSMVRFTRHRRAQMRSALGLQES